MLEFPFEYMTLLSKSLSKTFDQNILRTEFDAGPNKTRAFQCRTMNVWNLTYYTCSCENVEKFEIWFKNEIKFGALWFKWQDPCTLKTVRSRLRGEPKINPTNDSLTSWEVSLVIEYWS